MSVSLSGMEASCPEQLPELPDEVLAMIFQNLRRGDLSQVRLTCKRWNAVVGSNASLLGKYEIIVRKCKLNEYCEKYPVLSSTNCRYTRATLEEVDIDVLHPAWQRFAENLRELTFVTSFITGELLVEMLKLSPKLKTLTLKGLDIDFRGGETTNDYKLHQLENLSLHSTNDYKLHQLENLSLHYSFLEEECVIFFKNICPRVKVLKVEDPITYYVGEYMIELIESVQDTLEELDLDYVPLEPNNLLTKIATMERLKLKKFTYRAHIAEGSAAVLLSKAQPTIVSLSIDTVQINDQEAAEIAQNLPNLTHFELDIRLMDDLYKSFLSKMQRLVYLKIVGGDFVDIGAYSSPLLKDFHAYYVKFPTGMLIKLLDNCPNVNSLTLHNCKYEDEDEVNVVFLRLEKLERFNLQCPLGGRREKEDQCEHCDLPEWECECEHQYEWGWDECDCKLLLWNKLRRCPKVNHLTVNGCKFVTNWTVERTVRIFGSQLTYLNLDGCRSLTDETANCIIRYCHRLETLSMKRCPGLTDGAKQKLRNMKYLEKLYLDRPYEVPILYYMH